MKENFFEVHQYFEGPIKTLGTDVFDSRQRPEAQEFFTLSHCGCLSS